MHILAVIGTLIALAVPIYSQHFGGTTPKGLRMSFDSNRGRYDVGEPIDLTVSLRNMTDKNLIYEFVNSPICDFWSTSTDGKEIWRYSANNPFRGRNIVKIEPSKHKTYQATWNQRDNRGNPVAAGWYEVYAKFTAADSTLEPLHTRIQISGSNRDSGDGDMLLTVPVRDGVVRKSDVGKTITVQGTLRQRPQGLYIEASNIQVRR
jgi:hypothetical protein